MEKVKEKKKNIMLEIFYMNGNLTNPITIRVVGEE